MFASEQWSSVANIKQALVADVTHGLLADFSMAYSLRGFGLKSALPFTEQANYEHSASGCPLCPAHAGQVACFYRRGSSFARSRHRRKHHHFQFCKCSAISPASG